jgi:hypothetical protein
VFGPSQCVRPNINDADVGGHRSLRDRLVAVALANANAIAPNSNLLSTSHTELLFCTTKRLTKTSCIKNAAAPRLLLCTLNRSTAEDRYGLKANEKQAQVRHKGISLDVRKALGCNRFCHGLPDSVMKAETALFGVLLGSRIAKTAVNSIEKEIARF